MLDALVIGAGLGGLACAVDLTRRGHRVRVVEAHEAVGGYATCFERGPYRFDTSLHLLDGLGPNGPSQPIWSRLGLDDAVQLVRPEVLWRECWPGLTLDVPASLERWSDGVANAFPAEREGLRELVHTARRVHSAFVRDRDARLAGEPLLADSGLAAFHTATALDVVSAHVADPHAQAVVGSLAGYLGLGIDTLSAIPFLAMLVSYLDGGGAYPIGGSQAISDALANRVRAGGGQIDVGLSVQRIEMERGRVVGVELHTGERVRANVVVSNASPVVTWGKLLPPDALRPRERGRAASWKLGTSLVKLWLGLSGDDHAGYQTFLRAGYSTRFNAGTLADVDIVRPHRLDPSCCPEGHAVVVASSGVESKDTPAELADRLLERVRPHLPSATIEARVNATPATFERFTGNPGGTIHGFRPVPSQSGARRLGVRGPIPGLYQVGAWTYAGSGCVPAMTSGLLAAAQIGDRP